MKLNAAGIRDKSRYSLAAVIGGKGSEKEGVVKLSPGAAHANEAEADDLPKNRELPAGDGKEFPR